MSHTPFVHFGIVINRPWQEISSASIGFILLLSCRHECFTGKYTTRKIHTKLYPGPEWHIFHVLTKYKQGCH